MCIVCIVCVKPGRAASAASLSASLVASPEVWVVMCEEKTLRTVSAWFDYDCTIAQSVVERRWTQGEVFKVLVLSVWQFIHQVFPLYYSLDQTDEKSKLRSTSLFGYYPPRSIICAIMITWWICGVMYRGLAGPLAQAVCGQEVRPCLWELRLARYLATITWLVWGK